MLLPAAIPPGDDATFLVLRSAREQDVAYGEAVTLEDLVFVAQAEGWAPLGRAGAPPGTRDRWLSTLEGMRGRATERRADVSVRRGEGSRDAMLLLGRAVDFYDDALEAGGEPRDPVLESRRRQALATQRVLKGRLELAEGTLAGAMAAFEENAKDLARVGGN